MPTKRGNNLNLGALSGTNRPLVLPAELRDKHLYPGPKVRR